MMMVMVMKMMMIKMMVITTRISAKTTKTKTTKTTKTTQLLSRSREAGVQKRGGGGGMDARQFDFWQTV